MVVGTRTWDSRTWDSRTWDSRGREDARGLGDVINSPPWLPTMLKTPCVETILYSEFSRSNRQANISGRTMDAGNHRLLLTSSPVYSSFL